MTSLAKIKPKSPTKPRPSDKSLMNMMADLKPCRATDGCKVELDGECQHGHVSWLKHLGLI
jgi:hypothetical protein